MPKLINPERMDEDVACTFCGKVQPRRNIKCDMCRQKLPMVRPRFSNERPLPTFIKAVVLTGLVFGPATLLTIMAYTSGFYGGLIFGAWVVGGLLFVFFGKSGDPVERLGAAGDTPDYSVAGANFNSHTDSVTLSLFMEVPLNAVRRAWLAFFRSIEEEE